MSGVCLEPGCPLLRPCPRHGKSSSAPRSPWRNRSAQASFRRAVLRRDRFTCQRCGHVDPSGRTLEAHHIRPGYDANCGTTVCTTAANGCHRAIDKHAR